MFPSHIHPKDRVSICNPVTASKVAESFICGDSIAAGDNKIVIEAFPGPGALSRALLELPSSKIRKLIILEDNEHYLPYLRPLQEADPRVTVVPLSGFMWDTYFEIENMGLLEGVETVPWEGQQIHPHLHFISHLPHSIHGEQLIAQLYRHIPEHSWLYKYGRIPMSVIMGEWIWQRQSSSSGAASRCKVSVITEATAESKTSLDPALLLPYDDHFFPRTPRGAQERRPEVRRAGQPLIAANIIPYADQVIGKGMLDKWDYCLRRLFVQKSTPLKRAISSLAPGAQVLLKTLTDTNLPKEQRVDVMKKVRALTVADWALVMRAFDNWPFAPEACF
ncbi:Mitochondrial transcription factor 1 [Grifola frondosa]|uniref:rRNA adenine N(6)-methyltransferase n=1 Tax=Grifola frondosa TaxID=5627 RepID=A0A1C7LUC6_GRIFR|nr:Mitochondrial transcription factor 1 [Grifola frondosa]